MPLTAAAALGALAFGHVEFGVTASIIIGSVPAVLVGSLLSSRAPDRYIRPVITFVIFASGLKYVGVPTYPLGWTMGAVLVAGAGYWLGERPWQWEARWGTAGGGPGRPGGTGEPAAAVALADRWTTCGIGGQAASGRPHGQAAYFSTRAPTFGSAALMCLAAPPRTVP